MLVEAEEGQAGAGHCDANKQRSADREESIEGSRQRLAGATFAETFQISLDLALKAAASLTDLQLPFSLRLPGKGVAGRTVQVEP